MCVAAVPDDEYERFEGFAKLTRSISVQYRYKVRNSEHIAMVVEAKDIDTLVVILSRLSYETEKFHLMMGILQISAY